MKHIKISGPRQVITDMPHIWPWYTSEWVCLGFFQRLLPSCWALMVNMILLSLWCQESFNSKQIHHISILLKLEWLFWNVNIRQACSLKHERCQMFNAKRELKMNKQAQPSPEKQMKMNWKLVVKGHKRYWSQSVWQESGLVLFALVALIKFRKEDW